MKLTEKLMIYMEMNPYIPERVRAYFREKFNQKKEGATT